MQFSELSGSAV